MAHERFSSWTPVLGILGGILGTLSLVSVFTGEASMGSGFAGSSQATLTGWASFGGSIAVLAALTGLFVATGAQARAGAAAAFLFALLGGIVSVAANGTLALVVPTLAERLPDLIANPPTAIPAATILGGLTMAAGGVCLAVSLGRSGLLASGRRSFLVVAFVVAGAPLPSRTFLLGFALTAATGYALTASRDRQRAATHGSHSMTAAR